MEEIEVALLQRGCILNFVSIFFGLKEPFTAVVRENAQVFAISRQELFKHMPQSPCQAKHSWQFSDISRQ